MGGKQMATGVRAKIGAVCLVFVVCTAFLGPASARPWRSSPKDRAIDYSQILDDRGKGEIVMIWWLVPPIIENYPDGRALVDKYVLVGLIHAHAKADSTFDFDSVDHLVAADADGKPLKLLNEDEMPPTVAGALSALKSVFVHALGPMGKGTHWFAFEGGKVHACGKGRLTIPFAGETYFYDTPIPGCPGA
jgi:hypothetical protein